MTKNKIREAPLPRADQGTNDARPGLPTPTVRKNVTWVQSEPATSDIMRPKQLSPDATCAEPSIVKRQLAKGPLGFRPPAMRPKSSGQNRWSDTSTLFDHVLGLLPVPFPFVRGWRVVVRASRSADSTSLTLSSFCVIAQTPQQK
jgi:hypothetical protein